MAKMPLKSRSIITHQVQRQVYNKKCLSLPGVPSILNSMIENCKKYLKKGSKVHVKQ